MSRRLPAGPSPQRFADTWVKDVLKPAVEKAAGNDGHVNLTELDADLAAEALLASDNMRDLLESSGSPSMTKEALLEAGHRFALEHATHAAGPDKRISMADAEKLPENLKADFNYLRTGELEDVLDDRGYGFSDRIMDAVLDAYELDDEQALLDKAIELGDSNKYLNRGELEAGAQALTANPPTQPEPQPEPTEPSGLRWTPSVIAKVMAKHGINDEDAFLREAAKHDNGNRYISRAEFEAAAKVLSGVAQEMGIVSDLDKTIIPKHDARSGVVPPPYPGVAALMRELEGDQAGDMYYVTARGPNRVTEVPEYLEEHDIPAGPIETGTSTLPWLAGPEKVRDISKAFDSNPDQSFVMFGDSSHRDPEAYKEIVAKYPGRVKAAFIHNVSRSVTPQRVEGLYLIENYAEAAAILFREGVLDEAGARRVMVNAQLEGLEITDVQINELIATHQPG